MRPQHQEQRRALPITAWKSKIIESVRKHQVSIVVGETGSGKTTQIPQFIHEIGRHQMIGITQPRRVAAMTVAKRVSEEVGCKLGETVGYTVRFDDKSCPATKVKFLTDGMLVRVAMLSPTLEPFSMIILDEAHERTLQTDILFGIVKRALSQRKGLKVIVMSATLEIGIFQRFFQDFSTSVLNIPGRQYPVQVYYTHEVQRDILDAVFITTLQIHLSDADGSILVFLTGQDDIETLEELLSDYSRRLPPTAKKLLVCPLFAAMPPAQQMKAFEPADADTRKVILATNIAETSVTINGVRHVIDTGLVKQRTFLPRTGMERLIVDAISKAQAWQRTGRAGREAAGTCYRLYQEKEFESLPVAPIPEIRRVNMEMVVLQLKSMGVDDILGFDFIEPPSRLSIARALEQLFALGGLDTQGRLTSLGHRMAQLPVSPMHAKILITASELGCADEALTIIAMMSVDSIFYSPKDQRETAVSAQKRFRAFEGDHLTLMNVYNEYISLEKQTRSGWCKDHFINARSMLRVLQIRKQLQDHLVDMKLPIASMLPNTEPIRKAIVAGCFLRTAVLTTDGKKGLYRTLCCTSRRKDTAAVSESMKIHPSSTLFQSPPFANYILYNELVHTSKHYVRCVMRIERQWLVEMAPTFFRKA